MFYRQQFRAYAERCLFAAELSSSHDVKASLLAEANAWHQLAQKLELQDTTREIPRHLGSRLNSAAVWLYTLLAHRDNPKGCHVRRETLLASSWTLCTVSVMPFCAKPASSWP